MEAVPHVLLLGNSIFMDGIAESLLGQNRSVVTRIKAGIAELEQYLPSINPDLIIYELGDSMEHPVFSLVYDHTEVSHLGIDLKNQLIFLYHCKCESTGSMQELCDFIGDEVAFTNQKKRELENVLSE